LRKESWGKDGRGQEDPVSKKKRKVRASPLKGTDENKGVSSYEAMKK